MGWTLGRPRRTADRRQRRLDLESLELRTLLSAIGSLRTADAGSAGAGTNYDAIVGASAARSQYHVDGAGSTVAVIDAGVDYNNSALGSGLGTGRKVVAGYDFADNTSDPIATTIQHGTSVAGLIASSDPSHPGVAPGADIVALRVFDDADKGDFSKIGDALQWVIDNHAHYHITVVNLSISDGNSYTRDWYANDGGVGQRINQLISQLDTLNIPVVTATGNSFNGSQGVGFPAIVPDTISVTATDASDHIVSTAQRLGAADGLDSATDVAAPGDSLTALVDGNNFSQVSGTSYAAPLVSGAIVLMQQVYESRFGSLPKISDVDTWLKQGADPISDPATGLTIGRLDIPKAIAAVPNPAAQILIPPTNPTPAPAPAPAPSPAPAPTPTPAPTPMPTPGPTVHVWLNGQELGNVEQSLSSGNPTGLTGLFAKAVASLKSWWSGSTGTVRVWVPGQPGVTQTVGVMKTKLTPAHPHAVTPAIGSVMHRPWHSFAASRRFR